LLASPADDFGLEGRVPEHDHGRAGRHRHLADQLGRQLGLLAVLGLAAGAVALGVVAAAARDAQAAGGQQQAHDEAVATGARVPLLLAVAFLGPGPVVGAAEGVLGVVPLLADVGLVDQEEPEAVAAAFLLQE